jgi:hypothetical protein
LTITTTVCKILGMTANNDKQRVTVFIHPLLVKHAKAQAVVEELTLTTLVEKALINYLPKQTIIKKTV